MVESAIDRLFQTPAFTDSPARKSLFAKALRACADIQRRRFSVVAKLHAHCGFDCQSLKSEKDISRIPFLFISVFKEFQFKSFSRQKIALQLTSSGTSGQKSRIFLDEGSLRRVRMSAENVYRELGMVEKDLRTNYLCMTYDPRKAKSLGTAFTDELLTSFTRKAEVYYAIQWGNTRRDFHFNLDGTIQALKRMSQSGLPLRILGFPAHLYFTLDGWKNRNLPRLDFGGRSWILTGGGWKGHSGREIPKSKFASIVYNWLGIRPSNIRDLYGLVEHGIPYVECRLGRMHIPNYARVFVRDPETLRPLPYGRRGLLHLVTPYLTSYPTFSVLTSDWGEKEPRCSCGIPGEVLKLAGRAGRTKLKGCAISASEFLNQS